MQFFRALLWLYPASFRAEYEEELCGIFASRWRDADGWIGRAVVGIDAAFDTLLNAVRVHWDILRQDLRYAFRLLWRAPGFTLTAIAVAALGIGATTAAFTVTDHVLLRPLPFPDSERLVRLWEDQSPQGYSQMEPSPANYRDWKQLSTGFEAMAAYAMTSMNLGGTGEPERLEGSIITSELMPILGVRAAVGRVFSAVDDRSGAPGTILLSNGLWKRRFGGDAGVLGRKVILDDTPYLVIGVMPASLHFPDRTTQFWIPSRFGEADYEDRTDNYLSVIAKLPPRGSIGQAQAEMRIVATQLERRYPKENLHVKVSVTSPRDDISQKSRQLLIAVFGAALCVLLIACANLANLLLARGLSRRKELAVRTALGVGRERLVRQLLTESAILAVAGGALGVLLAFAALPVLARLAPNSLPIAEVPGIDLRVLAFAAIVATLTGVGFSVVPSLRACRTGDFTGLREGSRGGVGGRKERLRSVLVMAEVAGSVVLLVSAGLLIRALWRLEAVDPGFRADGVLTLQTALPFPKYAKAAQRDQFYASVLGEARTLPGVSGAAYISYLPMVNGGGIWHVAVEGRPQDGVKARDASLRFVTPGFFDVMGIPLRGGRDVRDGDRAESPMVAVVSESLVKKYWPGQNPLGRRFDFAYATREVVGVVGDVKVRGLERTSEPQVYLPYRQKADGTLAGYTPRHLVIRSSVDFGTLVPALRRIVAKADPDQPISQIRTLTEIVEADTASRAVQVRVLGAFAAIAFLLAGIGMHGLLSFTVSSRSQEFGLRMALGAQRRDILGMVLKHGVVLAGAGVVPGVFLAYAAGRAMSALLVGLNPADGVTFTGVVGLCLAMTVGGCLLPAIRAIRVDPTVAMRE